MTNPNMGGYDPYVKFRYAERDATFLRETHYDSEMFAVPLKLLQTLVEGTRRYVEIAETKSPVKRNLDLLHQMNDDTEACILYGAILQEYDAMCKENERILTRLRDVLKELEELYDDRADAEIFPEGAVPNFEMKCRVKVQTAIGIINRSGVVKNEGDK